MIVDESLVMEAVWGILEEYYYELEIPCAFCNQWHGETKRTFNSMLWDIRHPDARKQRGYQIPFN